MLVGLRWTLLAAVEARIWWRAWVCEVRGACPGRFLASEAAAADGRSLVVFAAREGRLAWRPPLTGVDPHCALHVVWYRPGGSCWRLCVVYSPPGGARSAAELAALACAVDAQCSWGVPALLGDFNCVLQDLPRSAALDRLGWVDPLVAMPTSRVAAHPKRIEPRGHMAGARIRVDWPLKLPVHAAHWVRLPGAARPLPE